MATNQSITPKNRAKSARYHSTSVSFDRRAQQRSFYLCLIGIREQLERANALVIASQRMADEIEDGPGETLSHLLNMATDVLGNATWIKRMDELVPADAREVAHV
jgi:hypothetical protein